MRPHPGHRITEDVFRGQFTGHLLQLELSSSLTSLYPYLTDPVQLTGGTHQLRLMSLNLWFSTRGFWHLFIGCFLLAWFTGT